MEQPFEVNIFNDIKDKYKNLESLIWKNAERTDAPVRKFG